MIGLLLVLVGLAFMAVLLTRFWAGIVAVGLVAGSAIWLYHDPMHVAAYITAFGILFLFVAVLPWLAHWRHPTVEIHPVNTQWFALEQTSASELPAPETRSITADHRTS